MGRGTFPQLLEQQGSLNRFRAGAKHAENLQLPSQRLSDRQN
jgi:hypothetical protein